ncbi:MAG: hypothetical protein OXF29_02505 [Hyphomicrobiales bacterium]|nr:hypothetical protein [Hyphomicrobiales bacterium]
MRGSNDDSDGKKGDDGSRRELIRERRIREQETPAEIAAIRAALREGERSGISTRTPGEIMDAVVARKRKNGKL